MSKPIEFLLENRDLLLSVYSNYGGNPLKTWNQLLSEKSILPKLDKIMKFNTFKQYLQIFVAVDNELQEMVNKKLSKLRQEITQKEEELASVKDQLKKLEHELPKLGQNSKNIDGWTIRLTSKGYYNLCKSFDGRVESIYIGKNFDKQKARQKIAEKVSKLRQQESNRKVIIN